MSKQLSRKIESIFKGSQSPFVTDIIVVMFANSLFVVCRVCRVCHFTFTFRFVCQFLSFLLSLRRGRRGLEVCQFRLALLIMRWSYDSQDYTSKQNGFLFTNFD